MTLKSNSLPCTSQTIDGNISELSLKFSVPTCYLSYLLVNFLPGLPVLLPACLLQYTFQRQPHFPRSICAVAKTELEYLRNFTPNILTTPSDMWLWNWEVWYRTKSNGWHTQKFCNTTKLYNWKGLVLRYYNSWLHRTLNALKSIRSSIHYIYCLIHFHTKIGISARFLLLQYRKASSFHSFKRKSFSALLLIPQSSLTVTLKITFRPSASLLYGSTTEMLDGGTDTLVIVTVFDQVLVATLRFLPAIVDDRALGKHSHEWHLPYPHLLWRDCYQAIPLIKLMTSRRCKAHR